MRRERIATNCSITEALLSGALTQRTQPERRIDIDAPKRTPVEPDAADSSSEQVPGQILRRFLSQV